MNTLAKSKLKQKKNTYGGCIDIDFIALFSYFAHPVTVYNMLLADKNDVVHSNIYF